MTERFGVKIGISKAYLTDKYEKCPICDYPFNQSHQVKDIAEWLNNNVKEYHRFELREHITSNGIKAFVLWDNEEEDYVKFRPLIPNTNNPQHEHQEYINFLNSLVEGQNK